jgi:ethanolaminephosphotransferase
MSILTSNFVSPQGEKNLVAYKYVGSDASLLYKYFFSPCAQFLVDNVIPEWLAPNVITLMGFMCTLIPHLIILYMTGGTLSGQIPSWLCFVAAFGQLAYMILDNADGKQARKTGSSSPLGLLFDHGCDAMNTFISGLTLFTIVQIGNSGLSSLAYMMPMTAFFLATWEEYYVDGLHLPIINGANEGIVIVIGMFIATGIFGTQIWITKFVGVELNMIVVYSFVFMSVVTILTK